MYEYLVIEVREQLWRGMSGGKLQELLNEHAAQGWRLKAITSADIKGRVKAEVQGVLVTFERPRTTSA